MISLNTVFLVPSSLLISTYDIGFGGNSIRVMNNGGMCVRDEVKDSFHVLAWLGFEIFASGRGLE